MGVLLLALLHCCYSRMPDKSRELGNRIEASLQGCPDENYQSLWQYRCVINAQNFTAIRTWFHQINVVGLSAGALYFDASGSWIIVSDSLFTNCTTTENGGGLVSIWGNQLFSRIMACRCDSSSGGFADMSGTDSRTRWTDITFRQMGYTSRAEYGGTICFYAGSPAWQGTIANSNVSDSYSYNYASVLTIWDSQPVMNYMIFNGWRGRWAFGSISCGGNAIFNDCMLTNSTQRVMIQGCGGMTGVRFVRCWINGTGFAGVVLQSCSLVGSRPGDASISGSGNQFNQALVFPTFDATCPSAAARTSSASRSPSPRRTVTPTETVAETPTESDLETPTETPTQSVTETLTESPTETRTASVSPIPTEQATITLEATLSEVMAPEAVKPRPSPILPLAGVFAGLAAAALIAVLVFASLYVGCGKARAKDSGYQSGPLAAFYRVNLDCPPDQRSYQGVQTEAPKIIVPEVSHPSFIGKKEEEDVVPPVRDRARHRDRKLVEEKAELVSERKEPRSRREAKEAREEGVGRAHHRRRGDNREEDAPKPELQEAPRLEADPVEAPPQAVLHRKRKGPDPAQASPAPTVVAPVPVPVQAPAPIQIPQPAVVAAAPARSVEDDDDELFRIPEPGGEEAEPILPKSELAKPAPLPIAPRPSREPLFGPAPPPSPPPPAELEDEVDEVPAPSTRQAGFERRKPAPPPPPPERKLVGSLTPGALTARFSGVTFADSTLPAGLMAMKTVRLDSGDPGAGLVVEAPVGAKLMRTIEISLRFQGSVTCSVEGAGAHLVELLNWRRLSDDSLEVQLQLEGPPSTCQFQLVIQGPGGQAVVPGLISPLLQ